MKIKSEKLQSNKAFTMGDLALALAGIMLFTGVIASIFTALYKVKAETRIDSKVAIYAVQITEYIDKIAYDEVTEESIDILKQTMKDKFEIPARYNIDFEITPLYEDDLVKKVKLNINYTFNNKENNFWVERLKVKEV